MADTSTTNGKETTKDGLALIVGGLFILALVFATYNYFNSGKKIETTTGDETAVTEKIKDLVKKEETEKKTDTKGDINGNGAKDEKKTGSKTSVGQNTTESLAQVTWQANDYQTGDINGNSYNVKEGDTLWKIAEGRYGNGSDWTKILTANASSVKYLPNGEHALIYAGQTLVLP